LADAKVTQRERGRCLRKTTDQTSCRIVERLRFTLEYMNDSLDAQARHLHRVKLRRHSLMNEHADVRVVLESLAVTSEARYLHDERGAIRADGIRQQGSDRFAVNDDGSRQHSLSVEQCAKRTKRCLIHGSYSQTLNFIASISARFAPA